MRNYMRIIKSNVVRGHLSKNYLAQKSIARNIFGMKYLRFTVHVCTSYHKSVTCECTCMYIGLGFIFHAQCTHTRTHIRAIPGLKQNVLSARISKLGIRSLVLPEPYVSCLKKLNMGLTGSSHYITINDFVKICTYFKHPPPEDITRFTIVTSTVPTSDVLLLFNNPKTSACVKLLTRLTKESKLKSSQENSASGGGSGRRAGGHSSEGERASGKGRGGGGTPNKGGEVDESYINSGESKCICT